MQSYTELVYSFFSETKVVATNHSEAVTSHHRKSKGGRPPVAKKTKHGVSSRKISVVPSKTYFQKKHDTARRSSLGGK